AEQPGELAVAGYGRLVEDDAALRVDARGDIGGRDLARRAAQMLRILRQGQRVQVHDAEDAVIVLLQLHPVPDRAQIIAQMQVPGRLYARENAVHYALRIRGCQAEARLSPAPRGKSRAAA